MTTPSAVKHSLVFYNNGLGKGGAHHSLLSWLDLLRSDGRFHLRIFCHCEGWFTDQLRARQIDYEILPMPTALAKIRHGQWKNRGRTILQGFSMLGSLAKAWSRALFIRADAVILTGGRDFIVLLPLVLRKRRHTATIPQTTDWGEIPTCRTMCRLAAKTFAISTEVAATITRMGIPADRVDVLPLIFTEDYSAAYPAQDVLRREMHLADKGLILGMTGVIRPHKGQLEAIKILGRLRNRGVKAHLVIVGAPPPQADDAVAYEKTLRSAVDQLGLQGDVTFAGWQSDVSRWMRLFDFLLVPSHDFEGVPRVILEGLEAGLPIHGSDLAQFREVLLRHGTGSLHPITDLDAWADAITQQSSDLETLRLLKLKAREVWRLNYSREAAERSLRPAFHALVTG